MLRTPKPWYTLSFLVVTGRPSRKVSFPLK